MKRNFQKVITSILLVCFVAGSIPVQNVSAENIADDEVAYAEENEENDSLQSEVSEEPAEETEGVSVSNMQVMEITESSESEEADSDEDDTVSEDPLEEEDIPEEPECQINHIVIVSPYLETPGTEEIMISYGDGTESLSEMFLRVKDGNGQISDWELAKQSKELYLFTKDFTDSSQSGIYEIVSLGFTDEAGEHIFELSDYDLDARFGVNQEYDGYEELQPLDGEDEDAASDESMEATIVAVDPTVDLDTASDQIVEALNNAENDVQADGNGGLVGNIISTFSAITTYASSSNIVVALDPGHDSSHSGARSAGGLKEEELTLKIANYCKEELENYSGVSVYMTRTSASCPYPETKSSSSGSDIKLRVQAAVKAGASIFVSFHLNDASATSAKGAEVIVQNDNWRPGVAAESKELAEAILDELANIGVTMRSTKIYSKNSSDTKYSDGSTADYYAVNRWTKENNIPGIIVEHAFLSNTDDVNNYLSTESGLKKLGVADATGIANYLGLGKIQTPTLKSASASTDGIKISWNSVSNASGYRVYRKKSGGSWAGFANTTSTSYTDTNNLEIGSTYYYTVRAFTGSESEAMANTYDSNYWSGYDSSGVSAKAKGCLSTPPLSKASASSGSITVSWSSVSGASGYRVYRKPSGGSWAGIASTTSTSYTDSSKLEIGTTYYYTVRAYKGDSSTALANTYYSNYWSDYDSSGVSAKAAGVLSTPTLKSATASLGSIKISWNSVSGADGYRVYRKPSGGSWAGFATTTSTSYTDTSELTDGKTYYYTVRAFKGDSTTALANTYYSNYWSDYSSAGVSAVAIQKLTTPTLSSATASSGSIKVTWKSVSGASGYRVYRKPSGGSWAGIGNATSTSYTDSSKLEAGTTYYYTVRAYSGDLDEAMAHTYDSKYWSGYQSSGVSAKAVTVVSTPTLSSASASTSGIKVTWKSVSGASGYRVYRKPSGGSWAGIATTTSTSYTDSSKLNVGTKYYYTVRAFKGDSTTAMANTYYASYWSGFDSVGVSATAVGVVSTPTLSSASASTSGIKITWKSVSGASGYRVYRKKSGGSWAGFATTTSTSYTDTSNLEIGSTYYYTVRAFKGDSSTALANTYYANYWSGYDSAGVSAKAKGCLSTPSLSKATASSGSITVSWSSVSGASGYRVYRKPSGGSWAGIASTTSTSYTDSSKLEIGTKYYYTVRAYKGDSSTALANTYYSNYWSDFESSGVSATAKGVLSTPTLKSATALSGSISVSWGSVSGADGYRVYRKKSGGSWAGIASTTGTSYTDSDNLNEGTKYYYTVRAFTGSESTAMSNRYYTTYWSDYDSSGVSATAIPKLTTPSLTGTSVVNDGIKVTWKSVSGASGYRVFRKTSGGSWGNIGLTTSTSYVDTNGGSSGTTYYYTVRAYCGSQSTALANTYDSAYWSGYNSTGVSGHAYEIAGTTTTTKAKMVALFNSSGKKYPSSELSEGGASTIDELAQIYIDEAAAEGIKAEVAWCQMILETGYLQYGGQVSVEQFNFAGIGATDGGAAGAFFTSCQEGVRAQIQHLKAYATTSALKNTCVDPRFNLVSRGCAKYVEILGQQENPTGNGWATGAGYGQEIVDLIMKL